MTPTKDGCMIVDRAAARKRRCCGHRVSGRLALMSLSGLVFLPIGGASDVLGESGPVAPPLMSAARVMANQAMTILDQPEPPATELDRAAANRPIVLRLEGPVTDPDPGPDQPPETSFQPPAAADEAPVEAVDKPESIVGAAEGAVLLASAGQPPGSGDRREETLIDDTIIDTISVASEEARRISVARNSTATITLKVPIDRAAIADPGVADVVVVSPTHVILTGVEYGTTQLILSIGQEQRVFHVSVELDLAMLRDLIKSISPTSNVRLRSVNGTIVLRGSVPDSQTAEQIAQLAALIQGGEVRNQLKVAGVQQTMLRVVVAEVNRESMRQLGVNWAIGGSDWSRDFFFANNLGQITPTIFSSSGLANVLLPPPAGQLTYSVAPVAGGATTVSFGFPRAEFQVFLNALRDNGISRILAEPNLVAISGQTATFLAGGEVPIPVAQGGAVAGAITVEYREFGVRLAFTPTVVAGQIIRLHIMSEVSAAVPTQQLAGGFPVFTFNTRRVESTIECGNGQTFAIAGLLSEEIRASSSKIPGLGDLPILGAMFSSTNYQKSNTELVVMVTPQLVEPLDPQQIPPLPGSLMTEPSDYDLFALQKLEGTPKVLPETDRVPREHAPVNVWPGETTSWATTQLALRGPWGLAHFAE